MTSKEAVGMATAHRSKFVLQQVFFEGKTIPMISWKQPRQLHSSLLMQTKRDTINLE